MRYGYFDLAEKEYVITDPATPAPWVNYLGDPEYGAIISNNAAGYSFVKSGANGRITRFRFNSDMALPGRYIYIRDEEKNDYWSASWQPVGKPLSLYHSECRHGTGYTSISAEYAGIRSCVTTMSPLESLMKYGASGSQTRIPANAAFPSSGLWNSQMKATMSRIR